MQIGQKDKHDPHLVHIHWCPQSKHTVLVALSQQILQVRLSLWASWALSARFRTSSSFSSASRLSCAIDRNAASRKLALSFAQRRAAALVYTGSGSP